MRSATFGGNGIQFDELSLIEDSGIFFLVCRFPKVNLFSKKHKIMAQKNFASYCNILAGKEVLFFEAVLALFFSRGFYINIIEGSNSMRCKKKLRR